MTTALTPSVDNPRWRQTLRVLPDARRRASLPDHPAFGLPRRPRVVLQPRTKHRAIKRCNDCPFRGRCGYNAVATGATHGIWGGVILPGAQPKALKPVYARLAAQFEQRRRTELGDIRVAPLPELIDDEETDADDDPLVFQVGAA